MFELFPYSMTYDLEKQIQSMENSSKTKHRKPIFDSKKPSDSSTVDKLYQTSPAFNRSSSLHQQNQQSQISYQSHIIYTPKPQQHQFVRSASLARTVNPVSIRLSSPPPTVIQQPHPQRSSTPQARMSYQVADVYRHSSPPKIISRPMNYQPVLSRTISPSFFNQSQNIEAPFMRRAEVKPTLVAVERVMKTVGENQGERQIRVLKPNLQPCFRASTIKEPQQIRGYETLQRKIQDDEKIIKLAEMNDVLAESYDNLYDQLQSLKGEVIEKEVLTENLFLKKTCLQIQSIFNFYTHDTLTKLNKMQRQRREKEFQKKQVTELTMKYSRVL